MPPAASLLSRAGRALGRALAALTPLLLLLAISGSLTYFGYGQLALASPVVRWLSVALLGLAALAVALPRRRPRTHVALVAVLFGVLAALALTRVLGRWPFTWDAMPDARYAALIATAAAVTAIGLLREAVWARWAALALGGGSTLGGVLNSLGQLGWRGESAWLAAMAALGGALVLSQLLRPEVRARAARGGELWTVRDRLVMLARAAAISAFAAAFMLVLYGLGQPVVPATATWALALAPLTALGAVLVLRKRAAGLLLLGATGLALIALTASTLALASSAALPIAGYYACFWLPAALTGPAAALLALARSRRYQLAG